MRLKSMRGYPFFGQFGAELRMRFGGKNRAILNGEVEQASLNVIGGDTGKNEAWRRDHNQV